MDYVLSITRTKIDPELLDKFINIVNNPDNEKIVIYLNSGGGSPFVSDVMIDIINKNINRFVIIANDLIGSSAFDLFFKSKCDRRIMPGTIGMYHQSYSSIDISENHKPAYQIDKAYYVRMNKVFYPEGIEFVSKLGLTKKEFKHYKNGDDLYFQYDRLTELFNRSLH